MHVLLETKRSLLEFAVFYGNYDVVAGILKIEGLDVNKAQNSKKTYSALYPPLNEACRGGHIDIVQKIIKRNDIQWIKIGVHSALYASVLAGSWDIFKLLFDFGTLNHSGIPESLEQRRLQKKKKKSIYGDS